MILTYRRRKANPEPPAVETIRPRYDSDTLFVPLTRGDAAALLRGIRTETATEALAYALGISGGEDAS